MARRIVEGGYDLTLWARRPASVEPYADTAAKVAATPAELAAASDLVCLCVVGDDDVREVLDGDTGVLAGLAPGGIVAIHSTVHPDTCREIAETAAEQGVSVIDAPVSGGAPGGRGGHADGHGRRRGRRRREVPPGLRDVLPTPIVHLGPLGSGQVAKILNNLLFTANLGSAMSTLELGESLGIPTATGCARCSTAGPPPARRSTASRPSAAPWTCWRRSPERLLQKDVRHAASLAADASAPEGAVFTAADTR